MIKILITGGLGYLGARIANQLSINNQNKLYITTRKKNYNYINFNNCEVIHENLFDGKELDKVLKDIDIVIHTAAMNHEECESFLSEAKEFNVNFTKILFEKSIKHSVKKFIFFSTTHVYGLEHENVITEETNLNPTNSYAKLKKNAEEIIMSLEKKSSIDCYILRISNVMGPPHLAETNCWKLLCNSLAIESLKGGKYLSIKNPYQYRDFLCISDFCKIIEKLINFDQNKGTKVINIVSGKTLSILEMADLIVSRVKLLNGKVIKIKTERENFVKNIITFSNRKAKSFGLEFNNNFKREIDHLLKFVNDKII